MSHLPASTHPTSAEPGRLGAVVLAGGGGVRLGGVDKASIEIDGDTLLERAIAATSAADEVVVVGEQVPTSRPVTWTREDPPHGGPASGLLAGIDAFFRPPELVVVLAVDMPRVGTPTVTRLVDAALGHPEADAVVLVDETGTEQTLAGVYRCASLLSARPADRESEHGMSMRSLVAPLRVRGVPGLGDETHDLDTWEDLHAFREGP